MAGKRTPMSFDDVQRVLEGLLVKDLHARRRLSLAGATLWVIETASLAIGAIGQGLALACGQLTKRAIKQVDRMLSNSGIDVDVVLSEPFGRPADAKAFADVSVNELVLLIQTYGPYRIVLEEIFAVNSPVAAAETTLGDILIF